MSKRVFLIVFDSLGIGGAADAEKFGDDGSNTLKSISKSKYFKIKNSLWFIHKELQTVDKTVF